MVVVRGLWVAFFALLGASCFGQWGQAGVSFPARPERGYIVDEARLIEPGELRQIDAITRASFDVRRIPIVVVTIPSMASYGAHGYTIDSYAIALFNAWGIGTNQQNRGILLLVSEGDRKARIQLGSGWGYTRDGDCETIMDGWIIPNFKTGRFSKGILEGTTRLDDLAQGKPLPAKPKPPWFWPVVLVGGGLVTLFLADMIVRGSRGWALPMLSDAATSFFTPSYGRRYRRGFWDYDNDSYGSSWGGWGGGSSGGSGGSSGGSGGGATGSW